MVLPTPPFWLPTAITCVGVDGVVMTSPQVCCALLEAPGPRQTGTGRRGTDERDQPSWTVRDRPDERSHTHTATGERRRSTADADLSTASRTTRDGPVMWSRMGGPARWVTVDGDRSSGPDRLRIRKRPQRVRLDASERLTQCGFNVTGPATSSRVRGESGGPLHACAHGPEAKEATPRPGMAPPPAKPCGPTETYFTR